jgi:pimeloyl-ACP methyl ester carboxylesterase
MAFTPADLAAVRARTWIVAGERDPLYAADLAVEVSAAVPGATLWMIPGAGHGPIFNEHRAEFVARVLAFLT